RFRHGPQESRARFRTIPRRSAATGRTSGKRRAVAGRLADLLRAGHRPDARLPGGAESGRAEGADPPRARRQTAGSAVRNGHRRMIADYQKACQKRVDDCLQALFVAPHPQLERLYQAMHYSVMNGGKRVRPLLVYAACEALRGERAEADGAACAVELIHAYSLVHDDLPAMDD